MIDDDDNTEDHREGRSVRIKYWLARLQRRCQYRFNALICAVLGHLEVDPRAKSRLVRWAYDKDVDSVCLRCGKQCKIFAQAVDIFYKPSPVLRKISGGDSGGDKIQEPFIYQGPMTAPLQWTMDPVKPASEQGILDETGGKHTK